MVALQRLRFRKLKFRPTSTGGGRVKVKLPPNGRNKIAVKFFPASSKAKPSARRSESWFATRMRGRRITPRWQRRSGRRTRISPTKQSMEFETGRAGEELRREKRSAGWRRARLPEKFCKRC